jgi:hypothetical protein
MMDAASRLKSGQSDQKRNSEKAINEYRTRNIEFRSNEFCLFYKKRLSEAIPYFIIRNFLFDILRFAVPTMCRS